MAEPLPFLSLGAHERADILRTMAARSGRSAIILEKDIWVCWILKTLFSMPDPHPMAFKGGTSLSKVYQIIDRFSEDVDVTLDYRAFTDDFDPFADEASRSQIKRFSNRLRDRVANYVRDDVAPFISAAAERLAVDGRREVHIGDNGETIRFAYPAAVESRSGYIRSEVLLEFGGRNVIDPNEQHEIVPEMASLTPHLDYPAAAVTVLSPARTFWEKATLIHVECHRHRFAKHPERLSRHWFDLACLAAHDVGRAALADRRLLEDVVRHKKVFFHAGYANYDQCLDGRMRLVPEDEELLHLRSDYNAMRAAAIITDDAPGFDTLMEKIRDLEANANAPAHASPIAQSAEGQTPKTRKRKRIYKAT